MRRAVAFVLVLFLAACASAPAPAPVPGPAATSVDTLDVLNAQRGLELLTSYLVGTWNTIPQKEGYGDSAPARLRIARLWPERTDGYWLYWEYANPADEGQVTRQRIFRFVREGSTIRALTYRLPGNPAGYAGEWRKERPFESLKPDSLRELPGCAAVWDRPFEIYFASGTPGKACPGDRAEIRNEHSEFFLGPSSLRAWITGLDASGKQVDGPSGPSEFRKSLQK
jgi:hypothetical protein